MREPGEWLSTEEAAQYWRGLTRGAEDAVVKIDISAQKFRRLCRAGDLAATGIEVIETAKGYLISRSDLVSCAHRQCDAICDRLGDEELRSWPGKKVHPEA